MTKNEPPWQDLDSDVLTADNHSRERLARTTRDPATRTIVLAQTMCRESGRNSKSIGDTRASLS